MSKLIGIVGFSGSGKSTSLRNLPSEKTFIVSPSKGELPIPGFSKKYTTSKNGATEGNFHMTNKLASLPKLMKAVDTKRPEIKYLVIEDVTHFFNAHTLSTAFREDPDGWGRWGAFGSAVFQALFDKAYREDLTIILMFHPETTMTPDGERLKIKSPGTLLEREIDIPSYFTNLLYTRVDKVDRAEPKPANERYKFITNDDGYAPAKTMIDAFEELYIPNDIYAVLTRLTELANKG
jgi:hypothetical protein